MKSLPDMIFANNTIKLKHENGFEIVFNAKDALNLCEKEKCPDILVQAADSWQDIRKEKPSNRQYDWTYQTSYKGSIRGEKSVKSDPGALCDLENLKKRETIGWYRDIGLYDDELDDNGAVSLGVKIRIMPSCFFILVRYYLRVDKVIVKVHDCRIYHACGTNNIIREYSEKESKWSDLSNLEISSITAPELVEPHLQKTKQQNEYVYF